jgi:hypothetical protein
MSELMGDSITITLLSLVLVIIAAISSHLRSEWQRKRDREEMRRHFDN